MYDIKKILFLLGAICMMKCYSEELNNYYGKEFMAVTHESCEMYEDGTGAALETSLVIKIIDNSYIEIKQMRTEFDEIKKRRYKWELEGNNIILENFKKETFEFEIYSLKFSKNEIICMGKRYKNEEMMEIIFKQIKGEDK